MTNKERAAAKAATEILSEAQNDEQEQAAAKANAGVLRCAQNDGRFG